MFYDESFLREYNSIVKAAEEGSGDVQKELLALISIELLNIANELHEVNSTLKKQNVVPSHMAIGTNGAKLFYKPVDEVSLPEGWEKLP